MAQAARAHGTLLKEGQQNREGPISYAAFVPRPDRHALAYAARLGKRPDREGGRRCLLMRAPQKEARDRRGIEA